MAIAASELDIPALDWLDDPELTMEQRREASAAAAQETWIGRNMLGYSILRYEDVVAILRDRRWHSASGKIIEMSGVNDPEWLERSRERPSILAAEGEEHTRLRRVAGPAFSPRHADALRPFMRQVVNELIDRFAKTGEADIATDFCEPYPIPIICELFGAPQEDLQLFSDWATDIFRIFNNNLAEDKPAIIRAQDELDAYIGDLIERRRDTPSDDLISAMIQAESDGDRLSHAELVMMCEAVLMAGTDTTRNQLACAVAMLAEHPQQWALLGRRTDAAPGAVEELMRYLGAVRGTGRFASEDIVYRDVLFPAGTVMSVSLAMANHDARVFVDPDVLDIGKEPAPQTQLSFGSGIHYCLGAALARAELQEALPLLASRMPNLALDGEVAWKPPTTAIFGPQHLPVTFDPGH